MKRLLEFVFGPLIAWAARVGLLPAGENRDGEEMH